MNMAFLQEVAVNICYLDFLHAVGHRISIETLNGRDQTFTLEGTAHVGTLLLLTTGNHTPPQDLWDVCTHIR